MFHRLRDVWAGAGVDDSLSHRMQHPELARHQPLQPDSISCKAGPFSYDASLTSPNTAAKESHLNYDESRKLATRQISHTKTVLGCSALITTLCVGMAIRVLGAIRNDYALDEATKFQRTLLNFTSYCAILVNGVATAASIFLIPALHEARYRQRDLRGIASQCKMHLSLGLIFMMLQFLAYIHDRL
ncbi:hypothetical protein MSAN_00439900 [Mycena sanguinolenta]|uniref:Uncharacterized protein n=1 Tax=Mycena sanguinolenta TaxID=230812 RepID=A0A8H6ZAV0_9AGAR|nr:hypothetical protein MSAN_00439900 [Mycena sanguinolenta]